MNYDELCVASAKLSSDMTKCDVMSFVLFYLLRRHFSPSHQTLKKKTGALPFFVAIVHHIFTSPFLDATGKGPRFVLLCIRCVRYLSVLSL